jgi:hypothetical protein
MNGGSDENTSPSYNATNGGWNSATGVFTPTSGDPSASVTVGQFASVFTDGATTPVFIARVTAVSSTTVTVSTTVMAGTAPTTAASGISINVGGVWKGPNGSQGFPFGGASRALRNASDHPIRINLKNNAIYSITATLNQTGSFIRYQGYSSTPGDQGKANINGGTGTYYVLLNTTGTHAYYADIEFSNNGNSGSAASGIQGSGSPTFLRCIAHDIRQNGFNISAYFIECEAYACNTSNTAGSSGFRANNIQCIRCISHHNTGSGASGFTDPASSGIVLRLINCIAYANGQYGAYGANDRSGCMVIGCDFYNNGSHGLMVVDNSTASNHTILNNNFVGNGGWGVNLSGYTVGEMMLLAQNNAFGAGTQANASGTITGNDDIDFDGTVIYANDVTPWVDPDNGDFRISLAAAKGAGIGSYTQTQAGQDGTVGYPDIGAAQHLDSGSSSIKGTRIMGG